MLHELILSCYYLWPFLLGFFGLAGILTMIADCIIR